MERKTAAMGDIFYPIYPINGGFQAAIFKPYSDLLVNLYDTISINGQSNSESDAEIINSIEVTEYTMKDPRKGTKVYKKLIAQQVEEVFPNAVSITTDVIP